jgi:hypothetical protein
MYLYVESLFGQYLYRIKTQLIKKHHKRKNNQKKKQKNIK